MKAKIKISSDGVWFTVKVILIFIAVEAMAYLFGHFDAKTIAIIFLGVTAVLFIVAYLNVRHKDKNQKNRFAL